MRATIPMVDPEHFSPVWLSLSAFLFPMGFLWYMGYDYFTFPALGAVIAVGAAFSFFTGYLLWHRTEPNAFNPVTIGKE